MLFDGLTSGFYQLDLLFLARYTRSETDGCCPSVTVTLAIGAMTFPEKESFVCSSILVDVL
jgi:hypothetical protein